MRSQLNFSSFPLADLPGLMLRSDNQGTLGQIGGTDHSCPHDSGSGGNAVTKRLDLFAKFNVVGLPLFSGSCSIETVHTYVGGIYALREVLLWFYPNRRRDLRT